MWSNILLKVHWAGFSLLHRALRERRLIVVLEFMRHVHLLIRLISHGEKSVFLRCFATHESRRIGHDGRPRRELLIALNHAHLLLVCLGLHHGGWRLGLPVESAAEEVGFGDEICFVLSRRGTLLGGANMTL